MTVLWCTATMDTWRTDAAAGHRSIAQCYDLCERPSKCPTSCQSVIVVEVEYGVHGRTIAGSHPRLVLCRSFTCPFPVRTPDNARSRGSDKERDAIAVTASRARRPTPISAISGCLVTTRSIDRPLCALSACCTFQPISMSHASLPCQWCRSSVLAVLLKVDRRQAAPFIVSSFLRRHRADGPSISFNSSFRPHVLTQPSCARYVHLLYAVAFAPLASLRRGCLCWRSVYAVP